MRNGTLAVVLVAMMTVACGSKTTTVHTPVPRPFPGAPLPPTTAPPTTAPPATATAAPAPAEVLPPSGSGFIDALLATATTLTGTPYRNGGSDPAGFDCSGFVQWVFSRHSKALPREVRDQWQIGKKIDRDEVKAGDLVFFETVSRGASHVGIALGGDRFVHAPSSKGVVRVERFSSSYWSARWVGARRVS